MRSFLLGLVTMLGAAASTSAQTLPLGPDLSLTLSGGLQPRASVGMQEGSTRYGSGLRRARIQARVQYKSLGGVEYDVDGASGSVESVDLFAYAALAAGVEARIGYFPMPQPRGGIPTPYFLIDAVDRAAVVERWLAGTVGGDGRDLGVDVSMRRGRAAASLAVHNGNGTFDRATGNYREGISSRGVTNGPDTGGLAVSSAVSYALAPDVEVGVFASLNGAAPARTARGAGGRDYTTTGAHGYWGLEPGSQPLRMKLDGLTLRYADDGAGAQQSFGVSLLGAARIARSGEAFVRGERFWDDTDREGDTYATAGLCFSPAAALGLDFHRTRLTLAYQFRESADLGEAHLVMLQGQFAF